jgi:hypothetical protein
MSITTSYKEALHNKIFKSFSSIATTERRQLCYGFVRDLILKEILKKTSILLLWAAE